MKRYILVFCDLRYATALRNIVCGNFIVIFAQKIHIAIKRQSFFIIPPVNNKEENIVDLAVIFMTILGFTVRQKLITHLFLLISVRSHGEAIFKAGVFSTADTTHPAISPFQMQGIYHANI